MPVSSRTTLASLAAAAFFLAGCGQKDEAAEQLQANTVYGDIDFEEPANDASAVEMAADQPPEAELAEPGPVVGPGREAITEIGESDAAQATAAESAETVESNVSGM